MVAAFTDPPLAGFLPILDRLRPGLRLSPLLGLQSPDRGGDGPPVGESSLRRDDEEQRGDGVDRDAHQVPASADAPMFRARVMAPVIQRSATGQGPPCPPRRARTESRRTTMTTAASTTIGRIGAVQRHAVGV